MSNHPHSQRPPATHGTSNTSANTPASQTSTYPYGATPSPSSYFRRSSYASVAAGGASTSAGPAYTSASHLPNPFQSTSRLPHSSSPSSSFPPPSHSSSGISRSRIIDLEGQTGIVWPRYPSTMSSLAQKGPFGSSTSISDPDGAGQPKADGSNGYFIPSYLQGTRYAEKLQREHRKRMAALGETRSPYSSAPGSLSTSSSSVHIQSHGYSHSHSHFPAQKLAPSHRGLTHDIVEHAPRPVYSADGSRSDFPQPLPSKWSENDKNGALEVVSGGLEVKLAQFKRGNVDEASSIRADHPMPKMAGIYYYEVTILGHSTRAGNHRECPVGVGFCGPATSLNRLPGWEPNSWAYHGDDGQIYVTKEQGRPYGQKFCRGDIIGCGVNFRTRTAFFTRNGHNMGVAFRDIRPDKLYPVVGMKNQNEQIRANFGQEPFVFDINAMVQAEKRVVLDEIAEANTKNLYPPFSERQLIHKLIAQYLSNDGYVETANAFAKEVRRENEALSNVPSLDQSIIMQDMPEPEPEETGDAITRQHIRSAILVGDVDTALNLTREHYPAVIRENDLMYFRLRCRKFIEMIKLSTSNSGVEGSERRRGKKMSRSGANFDQDGVFTHQMELDDHAGVSLGGANGTTRPTNEDWESAMDTSEDPASVVPTANGATKSTGSPISDADLFAYGAEIRAEFSDGQRREIKRELDNTLALMAYPNPQESSLKELLSDAGRGKLAEDLNSAILVSQGKASSAAIERLVQQTEVMLSELGDDGGPGAFIHLTNDFLRRD